MSTSMLSDTGVARCSRICLERRRRVGVARGPQTTPPIWGPLFDVSVRVASPR